MLFQMKVYLVSILYFFGTLFMICFPPRNYIQTGSKIRTMRSINSNLTYRKYLNWARMLTEMKRYAQDNEDVASLVLLKPNTTENRSIAALELRSDRTSKKPGILIIGALNAMSWGAPNAIMELAEMLLYESSYQTPFFNDYDWFLIPIANPDGMHFAKSLRLKKPIDTKVWSQNISIRASTRPKEWNKNVEKEGNDEHCFGTHINRNFAYHWQDDVHKTPGRCCQQYPGLKPFSTAEAQAIRKYVDKLGETIHLAIHLHASFVPKKEFILYPWRYSLRQPSNSKRLQEIGEYAARQARLPDGRLYEAHLKRFEANSYFPGSPMFIRFGSDDGILGKSVYEVHQSSNEERVAGSFSDYASGVVGIDLVYIIRPFHERFPNYTDHGALESYVNKATKVILSVVRGWRSNTKLNTLSFFGRDVEF